MNIQQFEVPGLAQYSYIVSSGKLAIVIDPMRDIDRYTTYAAQQGLTITHVTETHIHADFASGASALAEATGAELALSACDAGELYRYSMPHRSLRDGDELTLGTATLRVLHTPGHTPEHLSFVLFDAQRSASEPAAIFTGDFLFVGSLGRPDLLGESEKQRLAHDLYRSLHHRIASLPDGVQLYPGHGAGSLCGSGISDRSQSTLGYERATQPLFKLSEQAFVDEILASVPPMPAYYPRMKQFNSIGAPPIAQLALPKPLSPAAFAEALVGNAQALDLRRPEAFGDAHMPSAINIGAGQNLSLWAGWMLDPARPVLLVAGCNGGDIEASRLALLRVGLDNILGFLAGGMPAWIEAGQDFVGLPQRSTADVHTRSATDFILDVRTRQEWSSGHIQAAHHIMLGDLPGNLHRLPKDRPILTVCGSGYRSSIAASLLQAHGFTHVSSMDGGMTGWNGRKLPTSSANESSTAVP
jgi:hydroxyacylglutathione hydrolase